MTKQTVKLLKLSWPDRQKLYNEIKMEDAK